MFRGHHRRRIAACELFDEQSARPIYSLRWFLLATVGIAALCGLREFIIAFLLGLYAAVYYSMLGSGQLAASFAPGSDGRLTVRFPRDVATIPVLFTTTLIMLLIYFIWHMTICMVSWDPVAYFYTPPVILGLSLYSLQRLIHILLHVAVYLAWLGNCWNTGRPSASEGRIATATSYLLFISYLADPWVAEWLLKMMMPPLPVIEEELP